MEQAMKNINCKYFNALSNKCWHQKQKLFLGFIRRTCILIDRPHISCSLQEIFSKPKSIPDVPPPPLRKGRQICIHRTSGLCKECNDREGRTSDIINQISKIRARNNENWMDILQLAFQYAPEEAKKIMKDITECDSQITELTKKLAE